jgi:hypothetical protein
MMLVSCDVQKPRTPPRQRDHACNPRREQPCRTVRHNHPPRMQAASTRGRRDLRGAKKVPECGVPECLSAECGVRQMTGNFARTTGTRVPYGPCLPTFKP